MATKYEVVASLVKREHDQLEWEAGGSYIDDGNHLVIINILRLMHEYKDHGPGPNSDWNWEEVVDEMFDMIARGFNTMDFDEEVFGDGKADEPVQAPAAPTETKRDDMPPQLDIPDQR